MKKAAAFLVDQRKILLGLFLALAAVSLLLIARVNINYDLTRYLPADSHMREGIRLMEQEFGQEASSDLRVMIGGLTEEERDIVLLHVSGLKSAEIAEQTGMAGKRTGTAIPCMRSPRNATATRKKRRRCLIPCGRNTPARRPPAAFTRPTCPCCRRTWWRWRWDWCC